MIVINKKDREHFRKVALFAAQTKQKDDLARNLKFLHTYADHEREGRTRCLLMPAFAPYSFYFLMQQRNAQGEWRTWFNGGVIYHGPHDGFGSGQAPTFSVSLDRSQGWQIHT